MHYRRSKKILVYFFLLLFVGSINNLKINDLKLNTINKVNILGLDDSNTQILLKSLNTLYTENIFFLIQMN